MTLFWEHPALCLIGMVGAVLLLILMANTYVSERFHADHRDATIELQKLHNSLQDKVKLLESAAPEEARALPHVSPAQLMIPTFNEIRGDMVREAVDAVFEVVDSVVEPARPVIPTQRALEPKTDEFPAVVTTGRHAAV